MPAKAKALVPPNKAAYSAVQDTASRNVLNLASSAPLASVLFFFILLMLLTAMSITLHSNLSKDSSLSDFL